MVSILTRPVGRVQHHGLELRRPHIGVSILTRPVGRVQLTISPSASTAPTSFNPHPARGPSATSWAGTLMDGCSVAVSILTRPVGRVQLRKIIAEMVSYNEFQSSPGPWAECNRTAGPRPRRSCCFNPHPARGPSATISSAFPGTPSPAGFNPHPARGPSATMPIAGLPRRLWFQSSPGPWAECKVSRQRTPASTWRCFNPHPARGPSATFGELVLQPGGVQVSILTRPVGRVQLVPVNTGRRATRTVSILTRPVGRVQRQLIQRGHAGQHGVSILTRPVGRVQL